MKGYRVLLETAADGHDIESDQRGMNDQQLADFLHDLADQVQAEKVDLRLLNIEQPQD